MYMVICGDRRGRTGPLVNDIHGLSDDESRTSSEDVENRNPYHNYRTNVPIIPYHFYLMCLYTDIKQIYEIDQRRAQQKATDEDREWNEQEWIDKTFQDLHWDARVQAFVRAAFLYLECNATAQWLQPHRIWVTYFQRIGSLIRFLFEDTRWFRVDKLVWKENNGTLVSWNDVQASPSFRWIHPFFVHTPEEGVVRWTTLPNHLHQAVLQRRQLDRERFHVHPFDAVALLWNPYPHGPSMYLASLEVWTQSMLRYTWKDVDDFPEERREQLQCPLFRIPPLVFDTLDDVRLLGRRVLQTVPYHFSVYLSNHERLFMAHQMVSDLSNCTLRGISLVHLVYHEPTSRYWGLLPGVYLEHRRYDAELVLDPNTVALQQRDGENIPGLEGDTWTRPDGITTFFEDVCNANFMIHVKLYWLVRTPLLGIHLRVRDLLFQNLFPPFFLGPFHLFCQRNDIPVIVWSAEEQNAYRQRSTPTDMDGQDLDMNRVYIYIQTLNEICLS